MYGSWLETGQLFVSGHKHKTTLRSIYHDLHAQPFCFAHCAFPAQLDHPYLYYLSIHPTEPW